MDPNPPTFLRRHLSRRRLLLGGAALTGGVALDAFAIEPSWLEITRHDVPVAGLPRALSGYVLAQVTDAHLTALGRVELAIVEAVKASGAAAVALTGDIVDRPSSLPILAELGAALTRTGAKLVATLGNWEHWAGFSPAQLDASYSRFGGRLLVNESIELGGVIFAGTDDGYAGTPRWDHTLGTLPASSGPRVLLTHSPAMFDLAPDEVPRFDLALAGHTHGGQLRLGGFAPFLPPGSGRFVSGMYEARVGRGYVSRGTGVSVVPARFTCRPELALFRLVTA